MDNNKIEPAATTEQTLATISDCFDILDKVSQLELESEAHENFREIAFRLAFAKKVILSDKGEYPESYQQQALADVEITRKCCDQLKGIV